MIAAIHKTGVACHWHTIHFGLDALCPCRENNISTFQHRTWFLLYFHILLKRRICLHMREPELAKKDGEPINQLLSPRKRFRISLSGVFSHEQLFFPQCKTVLLGQKKTGPFHIFHWSVWTRKTQWKINHRWWSYGINWWFNQVFSMLTMAIRSPSGQPCLWPLTSPCRRGWRDLFGEPKFYQHHGTKCMEKTHWNKENWTHLTSHALLTVLVQYCSAMLEANWENWDYLRTIMKKS